MRSTNVAEMAVNASVVAAYAISVVTNGKRYNS